MTRLAALLIAALLAAAAPAHAEEGAPGPQFVKLQPIILSSMADRRTNGVYSIQVTIQIPDLDARAKVDERKPVLTDAFTLTLNELAYLYFHPRKRLPLEMIVRELQAKADRLLPGLKARVLIVDASGRAV